MEEKDYYGEIEGSWEEYFTDLLEAQQDLDPKIAKLLEDNFWELV